MKSLKNILIASQFVFAACNKLEELKKTDAASTTAAITETITETPTPTPQPTPYWVLINTSGAPEGTEYPSAVWTGSKAIVYGGNGQRETNHNGIQNSVTNTGGIYDPSSDSWSSTSTTNAPYRVGHSAVWTGSTMLVYGGVDQLDSKNLFSYDPESDAWESLVDSNINARWFHTAIWTGSKMIVWGGSHFNNQIYNDGASYDPKTNTWASISQNNAPEARYSHQAIWTGSKMIVWGGSGPHGKVFNNGGIYDPSTDTWQLISSSDAMHARSEYSLVWTGNEMMLWGGWGPIIDGSQKMVGDFYFYDPATDSWRTVAEVAGYDATDRQSTVWTGSKMIVWGGNTIGAPAPLDKGAIFDPALN